MGEIERLREMFLHASKIAIKCGVSQEDVESVLTDEKLRKLAVKSHQWLRCPMRRYMLHLICIEQLIDPPKLNEITEEDLSERTLLIDLIKVLFESEEEALEEEPEIFQVDPMGMCMMQCPTGHMASCHFPYNCRDAKCPKYIDEDEMFRNLERMDEDYEDYDNMEEKD